MIKKEQLNDKQLKKLHLAASMIKATSNLYDGDKSMLPLWGGGVISHGLPKPCKLIIGITEKAEKASKKETTNDHLFRVTATAEYILSRAANLSIEQIENILLERSIMMKTTRTENNSELKKALKECVNKDDWVELYKRAGISYRLYENSQSHSINT